MLMLVMFVLDLSAAFGSMDHTILINHFVLNFYVASGTCYLHNPFFQFYANDTQLYLSAKRKEDSSFNTLVSYLALSPVCPIMSAD